MEEVKRIKRNRVIKAILGTIISVVFIVSVIVIGFKVLKDYNNKSKLLYTVVYYDDNIPGSKYDIDIYNNKIMLGKTDFCSAVDCEETVEEKKDLKYSSENVNKFIRFIETHYNKTKIEVHKKEMSDKEQEVFTGFILSESFFELAIEDYSYKVEYTESDELFYTIYLKDNGSILVYKSSVDENFDVTNIDKYDINFSKDNMNKLKEYIISLMTNDSKAAYKNATIRKDEEDIINSITSNDESFLNKDNKVSLSYTISYSGINCLTPTLYLYSDNTYEYYYTFGVDNQRIVPKTGSYNIDILDIITTREEVNDYMAGVYTITDANKKSYSISVGNNKINNLLKTLNAPLAKCLEQQN